MKLVSTTDQITQNVRVFDGYRISDDPARRLFHLERLRLGKQFVVVKSGSHYLFAPSRFAGYENCTLERHVAFPHKDGKLTTPRLTSLLKKKPVANSSIESLYLDLCNSAGAIPASKARTYWSLTAISQPVATVQSGESGFPDEVLDFVEGATKRVVVNAYERDPKARAACLLHHGYSCVVCNFNFSMHFGKIGKDFIHVHHLELISKTKEQHPIDPVKDLIPVCPNCHAMLHRSDPPFTIDELIAIRAETDA